MLPPFVPPSARVATEPLPVITRFVIDRVEHSFDRSLVMTPEFIPSVAIAADAPASLRSIDEFRWWADESADVAHPDVLGRPDDEEPLAASEPQEPSPIPSGTLAFVEDDEPAAHPAGVPAPVVNDDAGESTEEWLPSAGVLAGEALAAHDVSSSQHPADTTAPPAAEHAVAEDAGAAEPTLTPASEVSGEGATSASETAEPGAPADGWVAEERDAFDWGGVSHLAVAPDEERRAAEDWSSTKWDRESNTAQDHIAGLLAQIARRVRAGELSVQGTTRQMSPEAALAAVLASLLSDQGSEQ